MKAAFQLDNILGVTDPGSGDRESALAEFESMISTVLPDNSPITVYSAEKRCKVTKPGRAVLFDDFSVLLMVPLDDDGNMMTKAFDAETPEGSVSIYEALKETIVGPAFADLADTAREIIGAENIVEGVESSPGSFRAI